MRFEQLIDAETAALSKELKKSAKALHKLDSPKSWLVRVLRALGVLLFILFCAGLLVLDIFGKLGGR